MPRRLRTVAVLALAMMLFPAIVYALDGRIDGKPVPEVRVVVDTMWTTIAGFMVFLMQAGFAMVEGGFTRAKNVVNIMMKNIGDFSMASVGFWIPGSASCSAAATPFWEPPAFSSCRKRAICTPLSA